MYSSSNSDVKSWSLKKHRHSVSSGAVPQSGRFLSLANLYSSLETLPTACLCQEEVLLLNCFVCALKKIIKVPWWLSGRQSTCQSKQCGFDPWVRKILWRRKWQPTAVFLPGESHRQGSLVCYSPWGREEFDMTERLNNDRLTERFTSTPHLGFYLRITHAQCVHRTVVCNSEKLETPSPRDERPHKDGGKARCRTLCAV